jgi:predicted metal-dependent HD superfamily phosphohydrolase
VTIFIDPPLWPAHGTLFSHLVSDASLAELHAFASDAGIPPRAFDRDHYDVPQRRHRDLVNMGAREVSGTELVRRLISSGLRVPARERNESLAGVLLQRWNVLMPGTGRVGRELVRRWGEPHRSYHGRTHLLAVLESLELLAGQPARPVLLAAWFHDAVYRGAAGCDEQDSADLAAELLADTHVQAAEIAEVARLVLLTATHRPDPEDTAGALLCDADLAVLGRPPHEYRRYLDAVRDDYAFLSDEEFSIGRAKVVQSLLEHDPLFSTPAGQRLWEATARNNLQEERRA